ncbi:MULTISPECIES: hypothetical protein [unclassified Streptomyces]|uniref:hypothetical protein n=1 Tax=unclassified Streptomyces TaxID=2593676 RepID=UPI002DDA6F3D|nr:hypothetical protein [Streptomyces sp. NBC_01775]WSB75065.1 hypothetical protein OHB04_04220 [Streptomyces sp. NBC_01775]WSS45472.1 hypothetical protein OG220_36375 [Streptomyces sp. NBC_01187]
MTMRRGSAGTVPEAVRVKVVRGRRRRMHRRELLVGVPLGIFALTVMFAVPVAGLAYAAVGTDAPFLVNASGPPKGPAPTGDRVVAAVIGGLWAAALVALFGFGVLRRLGPPSLTVDGRGAWLGRGRHRQQLLAWPDIAAVNIVAEGRAEGDPLVRAGLARAPYVDLYPVAKADGDPDTPLGSRLVTSDPAAPGLRGRRYVIQLDDAAQDMGALSRAVDRFAPGKRLT